MVRAGHVRPWCAAGSWRTAGTRASAGSRRGPGSRAPSGSSRPSCLSFRAGRAGGARRLRMPWRRGAWDAGGRSATPHDPSRSPRGAGRGRPRGPGGRPGAAPWWWPRAGWGRSWPLLNAEPPDAAVTDLTVVLAQVVSAVRPPGGTGQLRPAPVVPPTGHVRDRGLVATLAATPQIAGWDPPLVLRLHVRLAQRCAHRASPS